MSQKSLDKGHIMNVQSIWREIDSAAFQEGIPESLIHEGMLHEGGVHHL